jgi:hypothetical protein
VPSDISGLRKARPNDTLPASLLVNWSKEVPIKESDLRNFNFFVIASEQLLRLDKLMRSTANIPTILLSAAGVERATGLMSGDTPIPLEDIHKVLTGIVEGAEYHPVIEAVKNEVSRISSLLMSFSEPSTDKRHLLRKGMVDALQSSILDVLPDSDLRAARTSRSIFTKTVRKLKEALDMEEADKAVTFSIKLTSLERVWNLAVKLGGTVIMSTMKARIASFDSEATARSKKFSEKFSPFDF